MTSEIWGDEAELVQAAAAWAAQRVVQPTDPKTTARSPDELAAAAGPTVTAAGIGAAEALRIFSDVLEPATRSQDDPMNLAYIPAAPTRAAVAFDLVTSAANVFGGIWEAGAGAIYAENEALGWIIELLDWPAECRGLLRRRRHRREPLGARRGAACCSVPSRRAAARRMEAGLHR